MAPGSGGAVQTGASRDTRREKISTSPAPEFFIAYSHYPHIRIAVQVTIVYSVI